MAGVKIYAKALRPCRKCGQVPTITWDYYDTANDKVYYLKCKCRRSIMLFIGMEDAIEAWNKEQEGKTNESND